MTKEISTPTIGEQLLQLKSRSNLSLAQIATIAGYRSASAIQRFFNKDYAPTQPTGMVGKRLASALSGRGQPPIEEKEVLDLFEVERQPLPVSLQTGGGWVSQSARIPITSALWISEGTNYQGLEFLDVFVRNRTDLTIATPDHLKGTALAGFYLPTSNMWPKFEAGELLVFDATRPVRAGDYAISRLELKHGGDQLFFIAKVVRIDRDSISFSQFNPECTFEVEGQMIDFMARIVTVEDVLPSMEALYT